MLEQAGIRTEGAGGGSGVGVKNKTTPGGRH